MLNFELNYNKIGNLLIRLIEHSKELGESLYLTKLLKMVYLIDEQAVKETGVPVTWFDYKAWDMGPVAEPIYFTRHESKEFSDFIDVYFDGSGYKFDSQKKFSDDDFSEYELDLVNRILREHGHKDGKTLVEMTHEKGTPYDNTVKKYNIIFDDIIKTSQTKIQLQELIVDDHEKMLVYNEVKAGMRFEKSLHC